jgi:hypothetical protein
VDPSDSHSDGWHQDGQEINGVKPIIDEHQDKGDNKVK